MPFKIEDGTPVKLRLQRNISSEDAQTGDKVDFDVLDEVTVDGVTVIPKGSIAWGTVTEAQPKRRLARGGKLDVNIDAVRLADGEKCPLRAVKGVKGGGHTAGMTAGIVATGFIVWPAAPFFLFMHGKDITIPEGTEITAYVNGNMKLRSSEVHIARVSDSHAILQAGTHDGSRKQTRIVGSRHFERRHSTGAGQHLLKFDAGWR